MRVYKDCTKYRKYVYISHFPLDCNDICIISQNCLEFFSHARPRHVFRSLYNGPDQGSESMGLLNGHSADYQVGPASFIYFFHIAGNCSKWPARCRYIFLCFESYVFRVIRKCPGAVDCMVGNWYSNRLLLILRLPTDNIKLSKWVN